MGSTAPVSGGDHRDRRDPPGDVGVDRLRQQVGPHPAEPVERDRPEIVRADPEQLDRARDRVVDLFGAVHGRVTGGETAVARAGQRPLSCRRDRRQVADRAAARERAVRRRVPDELGDPADRLMLHHRGGAGVDGQIDVVRLCQQIPDRPDLEARRPDEREVPRPGLGDRLVQDPRCIVERLVDGNRVLRKGAPDQLAYALVQRGLLWTEPVERPPRLRDQLRRMLQRLLARRVEA
jgi:hypothetical protein